MAEHRTNTIAVTNRIATVSSHSKTSTNQLVTHTPTYRISSLRLIKPDMDITQHISIAINWENKVFINAADQVRENPILFINLAR